MKKTLIIMMIGLMIVSSIAYAQERIEAPQVNGMKEVVEPLIVERESQIQEMKFDYTAPEQGFFGSLYTDLLVTLGLKEPPIEEARLAAYDQVQGIIDDQNIETPYAVLLTRYNTELVQQKVPKYVVNERCEEYYIQYRIENEREGEPNVACFNNMTANERQCKISLPEWSSCEELNGTETIKVPMPKTFWQEFVTPTKTFIIDASKEWCYNDPEHRSFVCKSKTRCDGKLQTETYPSDGCSWREISYNYDVNNDIISTQKGDNDISILPFESTSDKMTNDKASTIPFIDASIYTVGVKP